MIKTLERLERLIRFIKDCVKNKYTGELIIQFTNGSPVDIRRKERIKL